MYTESGLGLIIDVQYVANAAQSEGLGQDAEHRGAVDGDGSGICGVVLILFL